MKQVFERLTIIFALAASLNAGFLIAQNTDSLQRSASMDPWKTLFNAEGFKVSFIFYSNADNYHDGVVIKVHNKNNRSISYRFQLIFRSDTVDNNALVEGSLKPGETKTGSNSHLFWVPFKDGKTISEVGIRGCRVNYLKQD